MNSGWLFGTVEIPISVCAIGIPAASANSSNLVSAPGELYALSNDQQRTFGRIDHFDGPLDRFRINLRMRLVAAQINARFITVIELLDLSVFRNIDHHRPGTSRAGDVISLGDRTRNFGRFGHLKFHFEIGIVMLIVSASWKASVPSRVEGTCPVMQMIGVESSIASAIPVTRFVAPGPDVARQTPTLPVARA